jgi:hypothetical protein
LTGFTGLQMMGWWYGKGKKIGEASEVRIWIGLL